MWKRLISEQNRQTFRQFLDIAKPYWKSDVKWQAIGLLALVLTFTAAVNGLNVIINFTAGHWMTAMQGKDIPTFYRMTMIYLSVFAVGTPIVVMNSWITDKLGLHWRGWLTKHILAKYMQNRNYYRVSNMPGIDNPDERMAADISSFVSYSLSLSLSLISAVIQFCSFILILIAISHTLVAVVLVYAICGTLLTFFVGRRLVGLRYNQLRKDADFRYNLIHIRTNVESIAFYQGEKQESKRAFDRLNEALSNFNLLIGWQRNLGFVTTAYTYIIALIPALIIAPLYFKGAVEFGFITQADMAFGQILGSLSIFVSSFETLAAFTAVVQRLGRFNAALDETRVGCGNTIETVEAERLEMKDVTLQTPDCSRTLVEHVNVTVPTGAGVLFKGPSGAGKSSMLRAFGGLWTDGAGQVLRPELTHILFLPQKPYMPQGTLRDQLIYPRGDQNTSEAALQDILHRVNLPDLAKRIGGFDVELDFANVLSLGEQQRLAFARLLLARPKYAILDEATSALDVANEESLYRQLQESGTTFISVGHRPTLEHFHTKILELTGDGSYRVYDVEPRQ